MCRLARALSGLTTAAVLFASGADRSRGAEEQGDIAPYFVLANLEEPDATAGSVALSSREAPADAALPTPEDKSKSVCAGTCETPGNAREAPDCADEWGASPSHHPLCIDPCAGRSPWYVSVSGGWEQREVV